MRQNAWSTNNFYILAHRQNLLVELLQIYSRRPLLIPLTASLLSPQTHLPRPKFPK